MPTYLCHGFRWQRPNIAIHVILQNLEDASPEWIIPPRSSQCILESFYTLYDFLPFCVPPPRSSSMSSSSYGSTHRDGEDNNSEEESHYSSSRPGTQSNHGRRSRSRTPSQQHGADTSTAHGLLLPSLPAPAHTPGQASPDNNPDELQSQSWSTIKLLEEYDPANLTEVSRPYAYVADHVVRIDLSASVLDEITRYEERLRSSSDGNPAMVGGLWSDEKAAAAKSKKSASAGKKQSGWFEKLRDQVQADEEIGWYVVVNGDEVRDWPGGSGAGGGGQEGEEVEEDVVMRQKQKQLGDGSREPVPRGRNEGQERMLIPERLRKGAAVKKQMSATASLESEAPKPKVKAKASSKSGFRRLFGRSKPEDPPK